jgi:hypothetical protein
LTLITNTELVICTIKTQANVRNGPTT